MKTSHTFVLILGLLIIVGLVIVVFAGAGIWGGGYRVDVHGKVYFHPLDADDWSSSYSSSTITIDQSIFTFSDGLWFWETSDVTVEIELWGNNKYTASTSLGTFLITGAEKSFTVTLRHVEEGFYTGYIRVYESEGGFLGFGAKKVLKDQNSFDLEVIL